MLRLSHIIYFFELKTNWDQITSRNKTFKGIAKVGKSTMGWFYGFKLHIVINDKGEILNFAITQANVDDREPLKNENFLKAVFGKLFADK